MIARLSGIVDLLGEDRVVVDVGGVGYLVFCSGRTMGRLPGDGVPTCTVSSTRPSTSGSGC
jgi:Holliday junction DNA helicase RuvA